MADTTHAAHELHDVRLVGRRSLAEFVYRGGCFHHPLLDAELVFYLEYVYQFPDLADCCFDVIAEVFAE